MHLSSWTTCPSANSHLQICWKIRTWWAIFSKISLSRSAFKTCVATLRNWPTLKSWFKSKLSFLKSTCLNKLICLWNPHQWCLHSINLTTSNLGRLPDSYHRKHRRTRARLIKFKMRPNLVKLVANNSSYPTRLVVWINVVLRATVRSKCLRSVSSLPWSPF